MALLAQVRQASGLTQAQWAKAAGTSRTTLSAYENGRTTPTLRTAQRLLAAAGWELVAVPIPQWRVVTGPQGRPAWVPSVLPQSSPAKAFRRLELPLHLNWSHVGKVFDLVDRSDRRSVYEIVLREGSPEDIADLVDGALLVDLWNEMFLPKYIRQAWAPLILACRDEG